MTFGIGFLTQITHQFTPGATLDYDSGWIRVSGTITADETVTILQIVAGGVGGNCLIYIDNVYFLESDLGASGFTRSAGGVPGSILI